MSRHFLVVKPDLERGTVLTRRGESCAHIYEGMETKPCSVSNLFHLPVAGLLAQAKNSFRIFVGKSSSNSKPIGMARLKKMYPGDLGVSGAGNMHFTTTLPEALH